MSVQTTSLFAYRNDVLPKLGRLQRIVFDELARHANMTNSEIAAALNWSINRVTPRTLELREKGRVVEACRRRCRITAATCIAWRVVK